MRAGAGHPRRPTDRLESRSATTPAPRRCRVAVGFAADLHRRVVTAMLALLANPRRDPPDRRMEEQQRFGERSAAGSPRSRAGGYGPARARERFDLDRRQVASGPRRAGGSRAQPADDARSVDQPDSTTWNATPSRSLPASRSAADCHGDTAAASDATAADGRASSRRQIAPSRTTPASQIQTTTGSQRRARPRRRPDSPVGRSASPRRRSAVDRRPEAACRRLISGQPKAASPASVP